MSSAEQTTNYGGQAVIEGVLMRGPSAYSIAVRAPDRSIVIETERFGNLHRSRLLRLPLLRGLLVLWEALVLGIRALTFSANAQAESEDERIEGKSLTITLIGSLSIGLFAFLLLPAGIAHLAERVLGVEPLIANLIEGGLRLSLLIGYVWGIGRLPEIQRVYGYHGAEHKTIHAFEAGAPLTETSVDRYPREHPRCGTAFLLTVALLSILVFTLLGPLPLLPRLASRIILIPVLAALAYEYIRFTARFMDRPWIRPLIWPNLALQRLTTREPSSGMIEVAIASFEAMRARDIEAPP